MYSPIPIKRSMKYGNNYWEVFSPKLKRNVRLFSDLEYDHWVLVETNPMIKSFCEQPLRIKQLVHGELIESIFDMWVLCVDGTESFVEVKYANELEEGSAKSVRSLRQTAAQQLWCADNGFLHTIQTEKYIRSNPTFLSNMKLLIPYIRHHSIPIEIDKFKVIRSVQNGARTISDIERNMPNVQASRTREAIYWMFYEGSLAANLDKTLLGPSTEVWFHDEKKVD